MGRTVMETTLDPVPRPFRACPGHIVINQEESRLLADGDGETFKILAAVVHAEDAADATTMFRYGRKRCPSTSR